MFETLHQRRRECLLSKTRGEAKQALKRRQDSGDSSKDRDVYREMLMTSVRRDKLGSNRDCLRYKGSAFNIKIKWKLLQKNARVQNSYS